MLNLKKFLFGSLKYSLVNIKHKDHNQFDSIMDVDYTVTALMFPAIPLIMGVYSNRFHTLSALVRKLHDEQIFQKQIPPEWNKQLENLNGRITLLKYTLALGGFGFLFNMLTVFALYFGSMFFARLIFGTCCLSMIFSIVLFIREIFLSTNALRLHLSDMNFKK